ncbi:MAG: TROVE domain-containing protein [Bryobacteraceae bacterium]
MANKNIFQTLRGAPIPKTNTRNEEHAPAYAFEPRQALAQYAATGCFSRTFYATAPEQVDRVLQLCGQLEPEYVAKVAIYSRKQSYMKDMPALLCAWLSTKDARLHEAVFTRVIDSAKMLRNYVQILRSGVVGRKSLGSAPKRLVRDWLAGRDEEALFAGSPGQNPSIADVLKMVHPKPGSPKREAFYGYMLGRPYKTEALPQLVTQFEQFKTGETVEVPDLPFTMLSSLPLSSKDWIEIAKNASWQTMRMNLNTFARHGVFANEGSARMIAARLRNAEEVKRTRVFPYQLLTAYQNVDGAVPQEVKDALQDAMELSIANVPAIDGRVVVCPDVSGSMSSPVTGHRKGSTSAVRCIDVAALVAAAVVRKNPEAVVLPFEEAVVRADLNARDSVMTNAQKLASIGGGGTNCSAPIAHLNRQKAKADLVIFVSDNESWVDAGLGRGTALMAEWSAFRQRNPQARLVCLDIQPNQTTQAVERADILNIGGFSNQVFEVISAFASGKLEADHWVGRIGSIDLSEELQSAA